MTPAPTILHQIWKDDPNIPVKVTLTDVSYTLNGDERLAKNIPKERLEAGRQHADAIFEQSLKNDPPRPLFNGPTLGLLDVREGIDPQTGKPVREVLLYKTDYRTRLDMLHVSEAMVKSGEVDTAEVFKNPGKYPGLFATVGVNSIVAAEDGLVLSRKGKSADHYGMNGAIHFGVHENMAISDAEASNPIEAGVIRGANEELGFSRFDSIAPLGPVLMGPCFEIDFCSIAYTRESVSDIAECWDKSDDGRYEDDGLIRVQEQDMNMLASNKKAGICVKHYAEEARTIGLENLRERGKITVHSR